MTDRIHAAVDARSDMVITARCQGWTAEGKDKTLERASGYREAGVEAIWSLPMKIDDVPEVAKTTNLPVMFIMNATTTMAQVAAQQVKCAVYATLIQNIASNAVYNALLELKTTGTMTKSAANNPMPRDVRSKLTDTDPYTERAKKYGVR
jgi:methylisocitrate lyase